MAAPSWAWVGAGAGSTTTATPVYPAGIAPGDAIFLVVWNKASTGTGEPPDVQAPAGWTLVTKDWGGTGTAGAGTGPVKVTVHARNASADGPEAGTNGPAISNPANSSFVYAALFGLRPAYRGYFTYGESAGSDTVSGTSFSATAAADPVAETDDLALVFYGLDVATGSSASAETITWTGATVGTVSERFDSSTTSGNDCRGVILSAPITAGLSSAAPSTTATLAAAATGVAMFLRVTENGSPLPLAGFLPTDDPVTFDPWGGAPDVSVTNDVAVTAGTAAFTLTGQQPVVDLGTLPGAAAVTLTGQQPVTDLGALPGAAPVAFTGQQATEVPVDSPFALPPPLLTPDDLTGGMQPWTGAPDNLVAGATVANAGTASVTVSAQAPVINLGALPGVAAVALTGQQPGVGLGALPGTATATLTGQQPVTNLGTLPGAAPVTFTGQSATVSTTEDPQSVLPPLLTPDDVTGGMAPWAGAPQGLVTGDAVVNAGVATVSLTALNVSSAVVVQGTGTAAVNLTAQNPSAAFSGTATAGRATVTVTAFGAFTGLGSVPGTATVGLSARQPVAGTGVLPGVGAIGLTAYDPTVIVPQSASGRTISGREGVSTISGKEGIGLATGREGSAQVSGREPVSSRSGEEPEADIKGRET